MNRFQPTDKTFTKRPCSHESGRPDIYCDAHASLMGHDRKWYCPTHLPQNPQDWRTKKFVEWKHNNPHFESPKNAEDVHIKIEQMKSMIKNFGKLPYDPQQREAA